MTNEIRRLTEEEVKDIFFHTPKTHDLQVEKIEYVHCELFPDYYKVFTNGGVYRYEKSERMPHKTAFTSRKKIFYDRIVKIKK